MTIIALALGIWFGWLLEKALLTTGRIWAWVARYKKTIFFLRVGCWCALSIVFFAAAYIFAAAQYDSYIGQWNTHRVQTVQFATTPGQLSSAIAFLLGWLAYGYRLGLQHFAQWLSSGSIPTTQPRLIASKARKRVSSTSGTRGRGRRISPPKWLITGVMLTASGVAVVVAIVVFAPDALSRLNLLKVGSVEARFATASVHSLRATAPSFGGSTSTRIIIERGADLGIVIDSVFDPVVKQLTRSWDTEKKRAFNEEYEAASLLLKAFAIPIARVFKCYLQEFKVGDTEVQHRAVAVANLWRRIALRTDDPLKSFAPLQKESDALIKEVRKQLPPGMNVAEDGKAIDDNYEGCDLRRPQLPADAQGKIEGHLEDVLSDGLVIAFIGNFIAFTQDFEQSAEFFEKMEMDKHLYKESAIGRYAFYSNGALAKYFAHWYPPSTTKSDLSRAWSAIDEIANAISDPKGNYRFGGNGEKLKFAKQYFNVEKGRLINNRVYFFVNEWLEGHKLIKNETNELQIFASELEKWIHAQPSPLNWSKSPRIVKSIEARRSNVIAAAYDTLATEQIVTGELANDTSKDRCARILGHLSEANDRFAELAKDDPAGHRDDFRVIQAHYSLYESFCGQ